VTTAASAPVPAAGGRDLPHPAPGEIRLESVLHALSDPMRLRIVRELAVEGDELSCSQFALPVTKSTSTHHFRVLREAGVIRQVYRGTAKMNGLRKDDLDELFPGLLDRVLTAAERQALRLGDG
jgi:DNA-binding transcriptional ArsR family regulator